MPIVKSTAKQTRPDALALFTDRVTEQEILRKILAPNPPVRLGAAVLLTQFYGVGGVGKSTLCQRACEIAAAEFKDTVRVVATSFDDSRWKEGSAFTEVAAELCRCLAGQKMVPRLTLTLLALHGQQTGRNGEVVGGLDSGWAMAFTAMEKGADITGIPGLGMVIKGAQWVRERSQRQALRQRLTDLGLWPEEQYGKLNILDLEKKLSSALYYDLLDWLKENPGQHVRLLLDGFERLQSSERREDCQRRLHDFISHFPNTEPAERDASDRFRVVIFGRNQLRWDEIYEDPTWRDYWNLHLLGGLAEADALDFLKKTRTWLASKGQSALAEALVKYEEKILDASDETKGGQRIFYPFYLNLAVELVERARQSGQELELGRAPAELQDRFFRYLEPRELRALMILALSEVFDESLFDWLARERLIEYPQHSFHSQLRREHSYLQAVEGREDDWRFHRLMEDALHARWQNTTELKREGVNLIKRVLDYYGTPLLAKPERDWADREVELWRRGMEIIVTQGPELGLLSNDEWKTLLGANPWSTEQFRCVTHRLDFTRRILMEQERKLGPEHPDTLSTVNGLGKMLSDRGEYAEAQAFFHRAYNSFVSLLGSESLEAITVANNLAILMVRKGNHLEAERLMITVYEWRTHIHGASHAETLMALSNLALIRGELGQYATAALNAEEVYKGFTNLFGSDHLITLKGANNLAKAILGKGDPFGPETIARHTYETKCRLPGEKDPTSLNSAELLANILRAKRNYADARKWYELVIAGRQETQGADHPDVIRCIHSIATVIRQEGSIGDATAYLRKSVLVSDRTKAVLNYNLVCHECLSGNVEEAKRLIAEEIAAKPAAREQALQDDDLKVIHDFIRDLGQGQKVAGTSLRSEPVSLPTSPEQLATKLFWLESHKTEAFSPLGIRYLQLRQTAKKIGGLEHEKLAYEKELPKLLARFRDGIASIVCDVLVQCPSCEPHAEQFAGETALAHPKTTYIVLAYDCKDPSRPKAGSGASVEQLVKAMFSKENIPDLSAAKNVVIVDDVYSKGKTAAAVVQKLWEWGLDRSASISVAVALRVMSSEPAQKFDPGEALKTIRSSEQQG